MASINGIPSIQFESLLNFRDVGQTANVLTSQDLVHEGLLYRSARPDEASPNDRETLVNKYHIKTIIDLRSDTEHIEQAKKLKAKSSQGEYGKDLTDIVTTTTQGREIPGIDYKYINLNGSTYSRALLWKLSWMNMAKFFTYHLSGYKVEALGILGKEVIEERGLIGLAKDSLEYSRAEVASIFAVLANPENYPVLVHCTQGKDRTGLTILLVLLLLSVPVPAMRADYEASEQELESEREERGRDVARIGLGPEFIACAPHFVEDMKAEIDLTYGGIGSFLEICGVGQDEQDQVKRVLSGEANTKI